AVVREAFAALGFDVADGAVGRTDIVLTAPEGVAVCEVKGLTGSAGERDAAQLEKWVSGYVEERGAVPKGVLVVNAFRDRALAERTERAFPDQMLPYANARNHCLLTGVQLLCLWAEVELRPDHGPALRQSIIDCTGVYTDFSDWRVHITETVAPRTADAEG